MDSQVLLAPPLLAGAPPPTASAAVALAHGHTTHQRQTWVGRWCIFNGLVYLKQAVILRRDKINFPTPSGDPKVATYNVMNLKRDPALLGGTLTPLHPYAL